MIQKQRKSTSQNRDNYARLHSSFQWHVPEYFNMAQACCVRWANSARDMENTAVCEYSSASKVPKSYSYATLQQQANRLSNLLALHGVKRGDRVAIVMPQRYETAVAYMAVLQMGAVAMPLSMLFGPEALEFRLIDSEAVLAVCDDSVANSLAALQENCPGLRAVLSIAAISTSSSAQPDHFAWVNTLASEAAVLIYTSGTTGPPKGALIPHRALIGNLTGFVCSQNWFGFDGLPCESSQAQSDAVFWSPADWAWTGGLMDALLPTLYFGRPIVAFNGRFSPEVAFALMRDCGVTHTFLFPTALKAMMKAFPSSNGLTVRRQFSLKLAAIMSAGEAVGDAVFDYCEKQLGIKVNEMFGQTEINYIVGNCVAQWPAKPGSMGKAYPGHRVMVIDDAGRECGVGVPGDVAVNRFDVHGHPDPIFFLGYWKNEPATQAKFTGDWCRTGDIASRDADGYLWYHGRADDVFKAAGYRIGPGEVENCLVKHPAVANAAVVPKPDAARGALVKAYVVLSAEFMAERASSKDASADFDQDLIAQLQAHVKGKLAPYEYPKEIEFVDALPMTTTGKVQRRVLRLQEEERARMGT